MVVNGHLRLSGVLVRFHQSLMTLLFFLGEHRDNLVFPRDLSRALVVRVHLSP